MPVVLAEKDYDRWLDPAIQEPAELQPMLRPYDSEAMLAYPVSTRVNSPRNDDIECLTALQGNSDSM